MSGPARSRRIRSLITSEGQLELALATVSHYCAEISLADGLSVKHIQVWGQRHTGQKYLINPQLAA